MVTSIEEDLNSVKSLIINYSKSAHMASWISLITSCPYKSPRTLCPLWSFSLNTFYTFHTVKETHWEERVLHHGYHRGKRE